MVDWPAQPSLPVGMPYGWVTPPTYGDISGMASPYSAQQIEALRIKFQEALMQIIVLAVNGFFDAGEKAFDQLSAWATQIAGAANSAADLIADLLDSLLGTGHTISDLVDYFQAISEDAGNAIAQLGELITGLGGDVMADAVEVITMIRDSIAGFIALVTGAVDLDDVAVAINTGVTSATDVAGFLAATGQASLAALGGLIQDLIDFLTAIPANLLSGALPTSVTVLGAPIGDLLQHMTSSGQFAAAQLTGGINTLVTLGGVQIGTLSTNWNNAVTNVNAVFSSLGSAFPLSFPHTFGVSTNTTLAPPVSVAQFQQLLDGIAGQANASVAAAVGALHANTAAVQSNVSQAIVDGVNSVNAGATAVGQAVNAVSTNAATAFAGAENAVGQLEDAANNAIAGAGAAASEFGAALSGFFGQVFGSWTNGSTAAAHAADVAAAAAAAREAARQQQLATDAINALTPTFYGGKGTGGLPIQSVTWSGTLPTEFTTKSTIATYGAVYNVATALTDQQVVSGFWNLSLDSTKVAVGPGPGRYLFFRGNSALTTYVYVKYWVENGPLVYYPFGTYPWIFNFSTSLTVKVEIGCVVGGIKSVLATDSVTGANFILHQSMLLGPQSWSLQATGNAITVSGPGGYTYTVVDGSPGGSPVVSQIGASYRSAGIGSDETSWLTTIADWNFYDSGPTSGPSTAYVATSEGTASATYADLPTLTDSVTVNINDSGLAQVYLSHAMSAATNDPSSILMSVALSGANTMSASDKYAVGSSNRDAGGPNGISFLMSGLNPGATTFKAKYRATAGTMSSSLRHIAVTPL